MKKILVCILASFIALSVIPMVANAGKVPQGKMKVTVDSEEPPDWAKELSIDGDTETFWHTQWRDEQPEYPHWFQLEFDKSYDMTGFTYMTRQDNHPNGQIKDYEAYVSVDGTNWGKAVMKGELPEGTDMTEVKFPTVASGKFFKLVLLGAHNEAVFAAIAELEVLTK